MGLAAGPIRNQQMIDEGKPDLVIAFPGGAGTHDMMARATKANLQQIWVILDDRTKQDGSMR
jgi:predicted Rossmann-fold nucleotide-binding protein